MPASDIPKTFRDGSVVLKDGTGTPLTLTLDMEDGNLSTDGWTADMTEVNAILSRGSLVGLRKGPQVFPTFTLSFLFTEFSEAAAGNVIDMIQGTGTDFAARKSTTEALGDVTTLDLVFTVEGTDLGDSADHSWTWEDCGDLKFGLAEGSENRWQLSGTIYGADARA